LKYREIDTNYALLLRQAAQKQRALADLPDGYISRKNINGKSYPYLQKRVNGKTQSRYIKADALADLTAGLVRRKSLTAEIAAIHAELQRLEEAAKILDGGLYRQIQMRKCSAAVDSIPLQRRAQALSFADALTALEGIPASDETEKQLLAWSAGQQSFGETYAQVLRRYNLPGGE